MSTAIALKSQPPTNSLADLQTLGGVFVKSGFFADTREAAQAIVKIMAGQELGFPPIASMTGVYIVKGKVSLSANLMAAAIKRSGRYTFRVAKGHPTTDECSITFMERDGAQWVELGTSTFTKADAKLAGTQNMEKYARNMLYARAMSNGAKWYCPDVFGGPVYTPEELGARVNEDGEIIDAEPIHQPEPQATPKPETKPIDRKRQILADICSELTANGISREQIKERADSLCDGNADFKKLSEGDIDGLIEYFSLWLDEATQPKTSKWEKAGPDVGDGDNQML